MMWGKLLVFDMSRENVSFDNNYQSTVLSATMGKVWGGLLKLKVQEWQKEGACCIFPWFGVGQCSLPKFINNDL